VLRARSAARARRAPAPIRPAASPVPTATHPPALQSADAGPAVAFVGLEGAARHASGPSYGLAEGLARPPSALPPGGTGYRTCGMRFASPPAPPRLRGGTMRRRSGWTC
jgi:hypothetical protein